jgi:hypothetical protein
MKAARASRPDREHVWRFEVSAPDAGTVCLVRETRVGITQWVRMTREAAGRWSALITEGDADDGFSYVTGQGSTYINCGQAGLTAHRIR